MNAPLKFAPPSEPDSAPPRDHYDQATRSVLRTIWARRWLVIASTTTALALGAAAVVHMDPRYTAEALIHITFTREEPATTARASPVAAMDASTVVESAARLMRSRTLASAVVSRLGLDREPPPPSLLNGILARAPILARAAKAAGISTPEPYAHEAAVVRLLGEVKVSNDLRSYLITVGVTTTDPGHAARLANAVATEYLRGQAVRQAEESYAAAKRDANDLSIIYGPRHPGYLEARAKQTRLEQRLAALQQAPPEVIANDVTVVGQTLFPAEKPLVASQPNVVILLAAATALGLLAGIGLAVLRGRRAVLR